MRHRFFARLTSLAAVALLALGVSAAPAFAKEGERIRSFSSDVTVRVDGTIFVRERIEYVFAEPRHGIVRELPLRYVDDDGNHMEMPVTVQSVTDGGGTPLPYEPKRNGDWMEVRIGDPDTYVADTMTYVISYEVRGALRYFADRDELHWNVTGDRWGVPIERSGATVRLPDGAPKGSASLRCFTGPEGSTAHDCVSAMQGSSATVAASGPLAVVVGWAPGIVAKVAPIPASDPPNEFVWVWWALILAVVVVAIRMTAKIWRRRA